MWSTLPAKTPKKRSSSHTPSLVTPVKSPLTQPTISIYYYIVACPFGQLLVGYTTHEQIAIIHIAGSIKELLDDVKILYPSYDCQRAPGKSVFNPDLYSVVCRIGDPAYPIASLDIYQTGSAFQLKVWEAISKIPMGETRTYGQIALAVGAEKSVRAVAAACGKNAIAVLVPCHRVVGKDSLGGYKWGTDIKEKLLQWEKAALMRQEETAETGEDKAEGYPSP